MTKKVLIAGRGFIGQKIAERLEAEVKFLSKSSGDYKIDITEDFSIDEEFDVLIHTVGLEPGKYAQNAYENVHVKGTKNLLKGVNAKKTVYISALGAGKLQNPYMETKKQAEELVKQEENWTIARPSMVYGEDNVTLRKVTRMLPLVLLPRMDFKLQPIHVDDLTDILTKTVENHGQEILELGGPEQLTFQEIFKRYAASQGRKSYSFPFPDKVLKKLLDYLGFLPSKRLQKLSRNSVLLEDNVIHRENDAEKFLDNLIKIGRNTD